ncbi:hypothetical protein JCM11641_002482 [Rhodosporidiobolus odoratus]
MEQPTTLDLVNGPYNHTHTLASTLHAFLSTTALFIRIPFHLLYHYVLTRFRSPLVQELGRPAYHEAAVQVVRHLFLKSYLAPGRLSFSLGLPSKWVKKVKVAGTKGSWIAPPGTEGKRAEDELVLLWIHGGGFFHDTTGACQFFFLQLAKAVNKTTRCSIFCIDYQLAPEKIYPSQLIEICAAYHHLVNELGIPEERICVGGDSAGGNLATAFLLHLARPNPRIVVPKSLGPLPRKPGSAFIVSPFINLVSHAPSRRPAFPVDFIDSGGVFNGSLSYVGAVHPYPPEVQAWSRTASPSWSPLRWFFNAESAAPEPKGVLDLGLSAKEAEEAEKGLRLLSSPYVNPNPEVVKDLSWYKQAIPDEGRTLLTWGGKEIFADDISAFSDALKKVGVAPQEFVKPLGIHDWVIFDTFVPGSAKDKNGGEQAKGDYAIRQVTEFVVARAKEVKA